MKKIYILEENRIQQKRKKSFFFVSLKASNIEVATNANLLYVFYSIQDFV